MWLHYSGEYRNVHVSCDGHEDGWSWCLKLKYPDSVNYRLFKQGIAESPAQAEYYMQQIIDEYWDGDGT